jgi:hypothetical protein
MAFSVEAIPASVSAKIDETWRYLMSFTVPLLQFKHGQLRHEASGVLIRSADASFVLTASHALRAVLDGETMMLIGAGPQDVPGISLSGLRVLKADDPLDIALVELDLEKSVQIAHTNAYINLTQCDVSDSSDDRRIFFVVGVPEENTHPSTSSKTLHISPFGFITGCPAKDVLRDSATHRSNLHLLLDYSEGNRKDERGLPVSLPDPLGMSGCGVWSFPSLEIADISWEADQMRLVAILQSIETTTRVFIATRLVHALRLIFKNRPDLRNSMRITFPNLM